ncbi:MAG: J domain-containing protein [Candidatus Competibacterales bacterium]
MALTHYEELGVRENATLQTIRTAYRQLSQRYHPDKHPPDQRDQWEQRMAQINTAYGVLSDAEKRYHYDLALLDQRSQAAERAAHRAKAKRLAERKSGQLTTASDKLPAFALPKVPVPRWPWWVWAATGSSVATVAVAAAVVYWMVEQSRPEPFSTRPSPYDREVIEVRASASDAPEPVEEVAPAAVTDTAAVAALLFADELPPAVETPAPEPAAAPAPATLTPPPDAPAVQVDFGPAASWSFTAEELFRRRDWGTLEALALHWTDRAPNDEVAWQYLGIARFQLDEPGDAMRAFRQAQRLVPQDSTINDSLFMARDLLRRQLVSDLPGVETDRAAPAKRCALDYWQTITSAKSQGMSGSQFLREELLARRQHQNCLARSDGATNATVEAG